MSYSDECVNQVIGVVMAFASGLFFTANSFVIKGIGLSFGEVSAIRSVIQTVLMAGIILANGISLQLDLRAFWVYTQREGKYKFTILILLSLRRFFLAQKVFSEDHAGFSGDIGKCNDNFIVCMRYIYACVWCNHIDVHCTSFYNDFFCNNHEKMLDVS